MPITSKIEKTRILAINIEMLLVARRAPHFPEWSEKSGQLLCRISTYSEFVKIQLLILNTPKNINNFISLTSYWESISPFHR